MDIDEEREKIGKFIKTGLVVLSIIMLLGIVGGSIKKAVTVSKIQEERKLPIYCVDCSEKKVALSFDAAWGNGKLG
jgi:peptidoglycan-N-acetylglucosamine deacetylase